MPTFLHLADPSACDGTTGRCAGSSASADPGAGAGAPLDGRSLVPLLLLQGEARTAAAAGWRREAFIEYYYNDPNVKCVGNCSAAPSRRGYPQRDASCCALASVPNGVCFGPMCSTVCYPTEDDGNNFIGLRRVGDGTL